MAVQVKLGKQPEKYLVKCTQKSYEKLSNALIDLEELNGDIKKLQGRKDEYRFKVPPYRIIFKYDKIDKMILVMKIDTRGDAYKMGVIV